MSSDFLSFGECAEQFRKFVRPEDTDGTCYIGLEHIEQGTLHLNSFGTAKEVTSAKAIFSKGDILFGKLRPYFRKVIRAPFDGVCSTDMWVVRAKNGIDQGFLFYWMASPEFVNHSMQGSEGTKMPRAKWEHVCRHRIPFLDSEEQRSIAHILGTLDDKIELNRRMNETLEEMARALFKSWFVDFDPVRAKMEGRDTGLPKHIADLFPDRMVDSELGEIPERWEVRKLSEMIEVNPKRYLRNGKVAPYLDMANMPTKGHVPSTVRERPFGSGMRFVNGDTLVARITPCLENGKTAYIDFLKDGVVGWGSTEYIVLKSIPRLPDEFAYYLARSTRFREFAIQNMTGTSGRQRVPARALSEFLLPLPPTPIAVNFGKIARLLISRVSANAREANMLDTLRDALLPILTSGKLRVEMSAK